MANIAVKISIDEITIAFSFRGLEEKFHFTYPAQNPKMNAGLEYKTAQTGIKRYLIAAVDEVERPTTNVIK